MRWMTIAVLVLMVTCPLWGGQSPEDRRRAQVSAATSSAVQGLYDEIARQQLVRTHTVGAFLDQTGGRDELMKTLQRAEQIGGPRWIDEETCQVHLEISGPRVARALARIAVVNRRRSPVSGEEVLQRLSDWEDRTFAATGTSTAPGRVEQLRPSPEDKAWEGVSDEGRRAAVSEATRHARLRAVESVRPVRLDEELTVGEMFDRWPELQAGFEEWFCDQPVTSIRFEEDLEVELTVAVAAEGLSELLRAVAAEQDPGLAERVDWESVQDQVEEQVSDAVGHGQVPTNGTVLREDALVLPREAPIWAGEEIEKEAVASFVDSRLKTARVAESEALLQLQREVQALPLAEGMTIGEAAERDPKVKSSVERALARATPQPPEYNYSGAEDVRVRVTLSLRHVWDELRGQSGQ